MLEIIGQSMLVVVLVALYALLANTIMTFRKCIIQIKKEGRLTPKQIVKFFNDPEDREVFIFLAPVVLLMLPILIPVLIYEQFLKKYVDKTIKRWYSINKNKAIIMTKSGRAKHVLFGEKEK